MAKGGSRVAHVTSLPSFIEARWRHCAGSILANNYASLLVDLKHFKEVKSVLRKTMPVARRVLGDSKDTTLLMRWNYAQTLYEDPAATLDDLCEAVTTLEDVVRIARRVFGGAHPLTEGIEGELPDARAALRARETPPGENTA